MASTIDSSISLLFSCHGKEIKAKHLFDQARLMDGETLSDPAAFGRRVNTVLASALG